MSQNDNRLMSIGEIAKAIGITRRIILNYEAKGLIQPDKKEGETGNRYYTPDSLVRIRTIRVLQNFGFSLDDIYEYFNGKNNMPSMIERLEKLRDEINLNIEKLKERVKTDNDFEIKTVTIPAQTVYCKVICLDTIDEKKEYLREVVTEAVRQYGSDTSKRMFFIEYSLDDPDLISCCVAVQQNSQGEYIIDRKEEKALCIFYHGGYESIPNVRDRIIAFAKENDIELNGTCQHIYLEGPPHHKDPENFITQVVLPIK